MPDTAISLSEPSIPSPPSHANLHHQSHSSHKPDNQFLFPLSIQTSHHASARGSNRQPIVNDAQVVSLKVGKSPVDQNLVPKPLYFQVLVPTCSTKATCCSPPITRLLVYAINYTSHNALSAPMNRRLKLKINLLKTITEHMLIDRACRNRLLWRLRSFSLVESTSLQRHFPCYSSDVMR